MSDSFWMSFFNFLAIAISLVIAYKKAVAVQENADRAAGIAEENFTAVKQAVSSVAWNSETAMQKNVDAMTGLVKVAESTYELAKANAVALHRIAELTKQKDDIAAAELAAKVLKEYEAKAEKEPDPPFSSPPPPPKHD